MLAELEPDQLGRLCDTVQEAPASGPDSGRNTPEPFRGLALTVEEQCAAIFGLLDVDGDG